LISREFCIPSLTRTYLRTIRNNEFFSIAFLIQLVYHLTRQTGNRCALWEPGTDCLFVRKGVLLNIFYGGLIMEGKMPLIGDPFPEIVVQTTHGKKKLPNTFRGKWFILFSHPADFTPVCTTEFHAFQQRYKDLKKLNCELIGMSIDQVFSHMKWAEWIKDNLNCEIEFPIIADTGAVAGQLGMLHPGKGCNTVRAVMIVDPKGILRAALYYPQELGRNIDEFVRMIKGFQVAEEQGSAMPANWPENELVGDCVIVEPPSDVSVAKKRRDQYEGFDWWFCYHKADAKPKKGGKKSSKKK
jgi:peroxiredoxin (alkyl hydroperoxide reductase subunit C)